MNTRAPQPPIVIHVPKTGGTTLIVALSGERRQRRADDTYRHILWVDPTRRERMISNAGDIFQAGGETTYQDRKLTLVLRNPIDRLESEYNFLQNRTEFRDLWKRINSTEYPATFRAYVETDSATESITKFLLGRDLYDPAPVETAAFDRLLDRLDQLDFTFGLTEDMTGTVANAEHRLGIVCERELERHRTSIHKAPRGEDWQAIEAAFTMRNPLDVRLYEEVERRFKAQAADLPDDALEGRSFVGGSYDGLLGYVRSTDRRVPFEIHQEHISDQPRFEAWKESNIHALLHMHVMSLKTCDGDGKAYLREWMNRAADKFLEEGEILEVDSDDPLKSLEKLTKRLFGRMN